MNYLGGGHFWGHAKRGPIASGNDIWMKVDGWPKKGGASLEVQRTEPAGPLVKVSNGNGQTDKDGYSSDQCKAEAKKIAQKYVHVVNAYADKTKSELDTDIRAGHLCYNWTLLVNNALATLGLQYFEVSWAGRAGLDRKKELTLWHNYLMVGTSQYRGYIGPLKKCQSILDPWYSKGDPSIYPPENDKGFHDPNYHGNTTNGDGSNGGEWQAEPGQPWQPTGPLGNP